MDSSSKGSFTVRVKRAAIPKVEPRSPRAEVDPSRFPVAFLRFTVINRGNMRGSFKLEAVAPTGWRILPYRELVELSPGESGEVILGLIVPKRAPPKAEKVILKAEAKGYESEAAIKVTVLPH